MEINTRENRNICVIARGSQAAIVPLSNLIDILIPLSNNIYLIAGNSGDKIRRINEINYCPISHKTNRKTIIRILNYVYLQLSFCYLIVKLNRKVNLWVFFMGEGLLLPALMLRLLGKQTLLCLAASYPNMIDSSKNVHILDKIPKFFEIINYILSNKIIIYSSSLIEEWNLKKYRKKIRIANEHILDFSKLKIKKRFDDRGNLIGYIGRLSEEKGILNFIKAIHILEKDKLSFLIGGDGPLRNDVEKFLLEKKLYDTNFTGWIVHDELPNYLNELKLIVIPSYTEGLPNIMLEAMACGTPVLATPVGVITDVIKDGETGFIMENNSPEYIAKNIIRVLNYPTIEKIIKNASSLVEKRYTHDAAIERYRCIFEYDE